MKTTRKILPALAMLLVSAIMLSTASYAWFASNSQVEATGMHVKVKANNYYLEIAKPATTPSFSSSVELTNTLGDGSGWIELITPEFTDNDPSTLQWYLGSSTDPGAVGTTKTSPKDLSTEAERDKFVLYNEVLVRMSPSSDLALTNLTLDTEAISVAVVGTSKNDPMKAALRLLAVAYDTDDTTVLGAQIYDFGNDKKDPVEAPTLTSIGAAGCLIPEVEVGNNVYRIALYLYFDGEDDVAITNNAANLDEYNVSVGFTATTPG